MASCNIPTLNPHPRLISSSDRGGKMRKLTFDTREHCYTVPPPFCLSVCPLLRARLSIRPAVSVSIDRHCTLVLFLSTWKQSAPPVNVYIPFGKPFVGHSTPRSTSVRRVPPCLSVPGLGVRSSDLTSFTRSCFLSNGTNLYDPIASSPIGDCCDWIGHRLSKSVNSTDFSNTPSLGSLQRSRVPLGDLFWSPMISLPGLAFLSIFLQFQTTC